MSLVKLSTPQCRIRAFFDEETVRVYQAYNSSIAVPAAQTNAFPSTFSVTRMTWIKPSFNWMAYRSGYSYKDSNQSHILAIDLHRKAFDEILDKAVLAKGSQKGNDVVVQWDPERTMTLDALSYRSIQIGLRGETVKKFQTGELIAKITDVTKIFQQVHKIVFEDNDIQKAVNLVPEERVYPVSEKIKATLNM